MDTNAAKNYLQNTELKFKLKAGATVLPAVFLLAIVLIETVTGKALGSAGDVYLYTVNYPYCSNFKPPFPAARF